MEDNARKRIKMKNYEDIIEMKIKTTKANSTRFNINIKGDC
jgi:hypothetical protein